MAGAATVVGFGAGALEQLLGPNVGQALIGGVATGVSLAADKLPGGSLFSPITNELLNQLQDTQTAKQAQDWINGAKKSE